MVRRQWTFAFRSHGLEQRRSAGGKAPALSLLCIARAQSAQPTALASEAGRGGRADPLSRRRPASAGHGPL